jgi:hypothetical protein
MHHLTHTGIVTAIALGAILFVAIGWSAGRAYQRAIDAWWRFRNHVAMTRGLWLNARHTAGEAVGVVLLAAGVVVAACVAVWILIP